MIRTRLLLLGLALLAGCGTPTNYSWGHYEDMVYLAYRAPDNAPPERQIEVLEMDFQKARSKGRPVPPGFHAHLGYLYYLQGKADEARREFETEKAQFPESSVFMDRLLASLSKNGKEVKQ
jgi:hypothetical protein